MNDVDKLLKKAHTLWREGKELEAASILAEAVDACRHYGDKNKLLEVLNEYGGALRVSGDYISSVSAFTEAKRMCEEFGIGGEAYATTLVNLANVYREQKKLKEADNLFKEAKTIFNKLNIKNYSYVGLLNNYSLLLQENSLYGEAKTLQEEAVEILKLDSKYRVPLAISYNNLYEISKKLNRFEDAKLYIAKAGDIIVSDLDKNHPLYAALLNNLADIKVRDKEYELAMDLYKEAINIISSKYGKNSQPYKVLEKNIKYLENSQEVDGKDLNKIDFDNTSSKVQEKGKSEQFSKNTLELSREFSCEVESFIKENYTDLYSRICLALVGQGSECYGYDDEISKDHACEIRCMILLNEEDYNKYHNSLFLDLRSKFTNKTEICKISNFYKLYTSFDKGPLTTEDFRKVEDYHLSTATNGEVFLDNLGEFTEIRNRLLAFYPEDLRLKFIALCLNKMAQAGQYNFSRLFKRNDFVAANFALNEFIENYIYFVHLINKKYMPFYKWSFRSCSELKILGEYSSHILPRLITSDMESKIKIIEVICQEIIKYLNISGMSDTKTDFFTYQAEAVIKLIKDDKIRRIDSWIR